MKLKVNATSKIPNVALKDFKRTKIIATVGPATNSYEMILGLLQSGANGIRLNFSHGTHEERAEQIKWIRKASLEYGKPVAIIQDLQGPKIRLGDFEGMFTVKAGQQFVLQYKADYARSGHLPTQYDLSKKVQRGERIYLYDGKVRTIVQSVKDDLVYVRSDNDGLLIARKGINLPDTNFGGDIFPKKDLEDIAFGSTQDIDYVALSFVQTADDIEQLKKKLKNLGSTAKVIAKVETQAAIENLEEIMESTDAVMIARGDLAIETPAESVPIVQRNIVRLGMQFKKPTIVATQMLASMTESPEPTRAEVSDVATAVIIGADCVMLSDETANGKYPLDAVKTMKRIILYTQENSPFKIDFVVETGKTRQVAIAKAVKALADQINATAIVAETKSGATALQISSLRPNLPIIVVTSSPRVAQQLAIMHGAKSYIRKDEKFQATKLTQWLHSNHILKLGDVIVTASGQYPGVVGTTDTIKVRVLE